MRGAQTLLAVDDLTTEPAVLLEFREDTVGPDNKLAGKHLPGCWLEGDFHRWRIRRPPNTGVS